MFIISKILIIPLSFPISDTSILPSNPELCKYYTEKKCKYTDIDVTVLQSLQTTKAFPSFLPETVSNILLQTASFLWKILNYISADKKRGTIPQRICFHNDLKTYLAVVHLPYRDMYFHVRSISYHSAAVFSGFSAAL